MRGVVFTIVAMTMAAPAPAALANRSAGFAVDGAGAETLPYLQCVPYARAVSGIQIYGDAHTWWDQAAGRYARGTQPRVGAVMSFRPYGNMRLGHVAAVSRIVDSRTVLLRHANWSLIGGRRGQIEDDVRAVDVSPANDWSEVRVWFAPIQALGTTRWPLNGFIYPDKGSDRLATPRTVLASAPAAPAGKSRLGDDFLKGIRAEGAPARRGLAASKPAKRSADPIGEIIARVS